MTKEFDLSNIDLTKLKKLKATHKVVYDYENFFPRRESRLSQYANVDDITLKKAPLSTLEGVANRLLLEAERKEQEEASRKAKRYVRSYIEKADYSIMSLYSDLKTEIEYGNMTWIDYRRERKKWRRCRNKFCLNMFPINKSNFLGKKAKRKDSKFCSDACRIYDHESKERYHERGSYLPVKEVEGRLSETIETEERRRSFATDLKDLEEEAYHNGHVQSIKGTEEQVFNKYYSEILENSVYYPFEKHLYK